MCAIYVPYLVVRFIDASFLPCQGTPYMHVHSQKHFCCVIKHIISLYVSWGWIHLGAQKPCQLCGCLESVSLLHGTAEGISIRCPCLISPQPLLMCVGSCSIHITCIFPFTHSAGINRHQPGADCVLQRPRSSSARQRPCCSSPSADVGSRSLKSQVLHMVP